MTELPPPEEPLLPDAAELDDPEHALVPFMRERLNGMAIDLFDDRTRQAFSVEPFSPEQPELANMSLHAMNRAHASAVIDQLGGIAARYPKLDAHAGMRKSVQIVQREWLSPNQDPGEPADTTASTFLRKLTGVSMLGFIAANTKPGTMMDSEIPARQKGEPEGSRTFRTAMTALDQFITKRPTELEEHGTYLSSGVAITTGNRDVMFNDRTSLESRGAANNRRRITDYAQAVRDFIASDRMDAASFQAEMRTWEDEIQRLREAQAWAGGPPIELIDEPILPPVERIRGEPGPGNAVEPLPPTEPAEKLVPEHERVAWLSRLALEWGNGARIVMVDLKHGSLETYQAVALPAEMPDGSMGEHAVAAHPVKGNAVYVFRGEEGYNEAGASWWTWHEAFAGDRESAIAHGATRFFNNTPNLEENVLELLTRDPSRLDEPRPRRRGNG